MKDIKIEQITTIKLEVGEKLLVKVPDNATKEEMQGVRESLMAFFSLTTERLLIYQGNVEIRKVKQ